MQRILIVLVLVFSLATVSYGQQMGLKSVAPQIGVIFPEDPVSTGFEIGVIADMGEFYSNFSLFPLINYWTAGGSEYGYDLSFSNFQIGADVHYYTKDLPGFFAGLGLSLNFSSVSWDVSIPGIPDSGSSTDVGLGILAGYEMPIDKYKGFVKGKFNIISNANTFELAVGLHFNVN